MTNKKKGKKIPEKLTYVAFVRRYLKSVRVRYNKFKVMSKMTALNPIIKRGAVLVSIAATAAYIFLPDYSEPLSLETRSDSENAPSNPLSTVRSEGGVYRERVARDVIANSRVARVAQTTDLSNTQRREPYVTPFAARDAETGSYRPTRSVNRFGTGQPTPDSELQSAEAQVAVPVAGQVESPFALAALGPVEAIFAAEDGTSELIVLGQKFKTSGDVGVSVGDYVYAGSVGEGELDLLVPVGQEYLLGVSEIRIAGEIDAVQPQIAQFSIGDTSFDYTQLLSGNPNLSVKPGDFVEVVGSETGNDGSILLGIHGSGIGFSSLQGIHGSGIGFSSLQGIHGSGIGFSSLQGIHGSGIGFSSLQGIHGSGIGFSSLQGIHGSGISE